MAASFVRRRIARAFALPVLLLVTLLGAGGASHAAGVTACRATFLASFAPALPGQATVSGTLRISGTLSECVGGASSDASISAGNVWTDPATGFKWQEPVGSISGSCINNASAATTIARWAEGGISITNYTSNSLTYGIVTQGTNVASVVLTAVNQQTGQGATMTLNATRDTGATMAGLLFAADSNDPEGSAQAEFTACSGSGLGSAPLDGSENFLG
jgi:hypothetical protein